MLCPHCKIDLQQINLKGTDIDICPSCYGIWLDDKELQKLLDIYRDSQGEILRDTIEEKEINRENSKYIEINRNKEEKLYENEIECPKCHKLMQKFPYAGSSSRKLNFQNKSTSAPCGISTYFLITGNSALPSSVETS